MLPNESTVGLQAEVERLENQCSLLAAEQEKEYHRANRAEACLSEIRALIAGYEDGLGDLVVRDITKVLHREADSG